MRSTECKKTKQLKIPVILKYYLKISMIQLCASPFPSIEKKKKTFKTKIIRVVE